MTPMVRIGSFSVPEPSTYEATTATIVDSARNVQGVVVGQVIRHNVAKVEMSWYFIKSEDWASLQAQFDPKRGGAFYNDVTFFNPDYNEWETRKMYVSDRKAPVFLRRDDDSIRGYQGASFSLVEV